MNLNDIPDDFPRPTLPAVVPGGQPEVGVALSWNVYLAGLTPEERYERWVICEDIAKQLLLVAQKDAAKYPHHSPDETLERLRRSVARKGWVSPAELDWLLQRMKALLQW
ncbi:hypothetical protein [Burkholderia ubonensis]|uniref:hypothetical protein n=1 Tax=Burkholderia ubonensis TaxID=101571 RepID=UPI00075E4BA8|nr:hypothetical protein [Burkholderia ubonensis]KVT83343.1 hypothetical protein WK58_03960 [Burkholderia ubonensis]KVW72636.1 hypothetical protein WK99_04935 [Burkholderia ubonensis]OJA25766.1 hypothetical protein BGV47_29875 [Burkholderia ubonensis]OJB30531.1 hypothetical protein BGV55_12245 [Burkholderia ubonensis]